MKLIINNQVQEFLNANSLSDILKEKQITQNGIAVAVNEKVISKNDWEKFSLKENDSVLIIKATQGG